jgi:hypothetical protein
MFVNVIYSLISPLSDTVIHLANKKSVACAISHCSRRAIPTILLKHFAFGLQSWQLHIKSHGHEKSLSEVLIAGTVIADNYQPSEFKEMN